MALTQYTIDAVNSIVGAARVDLVGTLEGIATGGAYKVPCRFSYPTGASPTINRAVVEPWNSVYSETFGAGGAIVFQFTSIEFSLTHLCDTLGYSVCAFEWNKGHVDGELAVGSTSPIIPSTPTVAFDPTWVITAGTDGYEIIADASTFSRAPATFFNDPGGLAPPAPQTSAECFGYGFSQTAALLRGFAIDSRNSGLGGGFPNGLVFEGILSTLGGAAVRRLTNVSPGFFAYSFVSGATPITEGQFINLSAETDVQMLEAFNARIAVPVGHYNFYEIAAVSHLPIETGLFLIPIQNDNSMAFVHRAMLENLRDKVDNAIAMPIDAAIDGTEAQRTTPLFGGTSQFTGLPFWGGTSVNTFVGIPGSDGNYTGGIRTPEVRTILGDGRVVGAPTTVSRGTLCISKSIADNTQPDAVVSCSPPLNTLLKSDIYVMNGGLTTSYETYVLSRLYPSAELYTTLVADGADHAVSQRWMLQSDRNTFVTNAAALTRQDIINIGRRRLTDPPVCPVI